MKIKRTVMFLAMVLVMGCGQSRSREEPVRIKVSARKYRFEPAEIHVKRGQEVLLEISSADVQHGFHVPDLGIDESIQKGKPTEIRFTADKPGEHRMECNIICGPGHDDMAGKIIVE